MRQLRYPFSALMGDYLRGLAGFAISLVIVVTYDRENRLIWLFVGLTLLFLVYTMRTVLRQTTVVELDDAGLAVSQWGQRARRIDWNRLAQISLRYYAPRKAKKKGFGSLLGRIGLGTAGQEHAGQGAVDREAAGEAEQGWGDGWMELTLRADGRSVTLDSALPGFVEIVQRAERSARRNGIALDPVTDDNLAAFAMLPAAPAQPDTPRSGLSGQS